MKKSVLNKILIILCILVSISLTVCSCGDNSGSTDDQNQSNQTPGDENTENTENNEAPGNDENTDDNDGAENNEATNTKVTYKVTVVDENDQPLAGATVQLCVGDICRLPVPTDATGVATMELDAADYTVKISLNGYSGEAQYSFDADSTELKVTLTKTVDAD